MRLVVQRVSQAKVALLEENKVVGKIGKGLLVLVGIGRNDRGEYAEWLAQKLAKLRVMSDSAGKMNLSVGEVDGGVLVVSQFTLYADTSCGNRPSFVDAADPQKAKRLYNQFINLLARMNLNVQTGRFGKYMKIEAVLDGPVTIPLAYPEEDDGFLKR